MECARPRWQESLVKFVESRNQRRARKCQRGPLQAPSRAESREGAAPGAEQKNAKSKIADKVPGLAKHRVQDCESVPTHPKQIMKNGIENLPGMLGRAEVCGFCNDDRQPNDGRQPYFQDSPGRGSQFEIVFERASFSSRSRQV